MTPQPTVGTANIPATLQGDREIFSSRLIHAPRARVFAAWTDPAQLAKWWGPNGFTTTTHVFDFRPEGTWEFTMHGPDGTDFPNKIHYLEIVPPERLVYKHGGEAGFEPVNFHVTVLFKEEDGKTRLEMRMTFPSRNGRDYVVEKYGAMEGLDQTIGRLEEYLNV
jgi:uncharacterized protein YndB with AHSA1/START domain